MNLGFETEYVEYKLTTNELDDAILDLGDPVLYPFGVNKCSSFET